MKRQTHTNFSKFYLGENRQIKVKDIDRIHGAIDSPTKMDKNFTNLFGLQEFDMAGLTEKASHRKYNHDPIMGLTKALAIDPDNGPDVYFSHILMDKMSNIMRDSLGTSNRDIAEILFNEMLKGMSTRPPKQTNFIQRYENKFKKNKFYRMSKK